MSSSNCCFLTCILFPFYKFVKTKMKYSTTYQVYIQTQDLIAFNQREHIFKKILYRNYWWISVCQFSAFLCVCAWLEVAVQSLLSNSLNSTSIFLWSEKAMAPLSSTLAWKIPWTEEPVRLQSMGSLRVRHDWATSLSLFTFMHWRSKWQPTPVFLPGESQGQGSLVGCHLWGRTESDTTEVT